MMKAVATILLAVAVAVAADTYASTWDNIDIGEILQNDRLLNAYVACLLDHGKCTPDGAALKRVFPEALMTHCAKCTEKQKTEGLKAIKFLIEKKPEIWQKLAAKYDPTGEHTKRFKNSQQ